MFAKIKATKSQLENAPFSSAQSIAHPLGSDVVDSDVVDSDVVDSDVVDSVYIRT